MSRWYCYKKDKFYSVTFLMRGKSTKLKNVSPSINALTYYSKIPWLKEEENY